MAHEAYETWNLRKREIKLMLSRADDIIHEYQRANITLTLRQLYYQFVSRGWLDNTERNYKRLGNVVARGRQSGRLDWDAIEDRARRPTQWAEFNSMDACLTRAMRTFRLPRQMGQDVYVELWVEKDALASVLEPIAMKYHVTLMVNRGYSSASAMRASAERIRESVGAYDCSRAAVVYLGDLDPSGEDMVRDIRERLGMFLNEGRLVDWSDGVSGKIEQPWDAARRKPYINLNVRKLALTMDQVEEHDPPPNPTKLSDSRAQKFIDQYGYESWEVDALPPTVLRDLIEESLESVLDMDLIQEHVDEEQKLKAEFRAWLDSR